MIIILGRVLFCVLAAWALAVVLVYALQRHLQYHPDRQPPGAPAAHGLPEMEAVSVKTADGLSLLAWFAPPRDRENGRVIVLFHGNAGSIADRADKARHFIGRGYGVYLCEYRGFGGNPGAPSEQGLYADARAALAWLEGQGYRTGRFVFYGESIGSGVAVQMAAEARPEALILEAPFASAADVAKRTYFWLPVDLMMKDRFDNADKIGGLDAALLIVHGDEDGVVPLSSARRLFDAAPHPKEFVTVNGGAHNDLYEHHAGHIVTDWLEARE